MTAAQPMPQPLAQPLIRLEGITKRYRTRDTFLGASHRTVTALNRISLDIEPGEIFGLVGESGSGKTTTGRLIVKLEAADEGQIRMAGDDITCLRGKRLKAFRRRVQMIFQDPYQSLNPHICVEEAIEEPLAIHCIGNVAERQQTVAEAMRRVGLDPPEAYLNRYPHQLSGGQRQRVAIARAIVLEPDLIVADEPTSMLDASIAVQIFKILEDIRRDRNVTLLFITHSLAAARYLCDRIGVIYRGHLVEQADADAVIRRPRHPYTRALIDALPSFGRGQSVKPFDTLLAEERHVADPEAGCPFFHRCRRAEPDTCQHRKPDLAADGNGHVVACFFAD